LKLPYDGESLKFVRRIRDEVHRFGITFHRLKRSKGTFSNELEQIKGIGKSTADLLLKEFRSITKIKEALGLAQGEKKLEKVIGIAKTKIIIEYFSSKINPVNKKGLS